MKKIIRENKTLIMICIISNVLVTIFSNTFPSFDNFMWNFGNLLLLLLIFLFIVIHYLWKIIFIKSKLKKVLPEDLITIQNYYKTTKNNHLLSDYELYFLFDEIDYICMCFYKMKKNIPNLDYIYSKEEVEFIEKCDNKEIINLYEKSKNAINAIYKYYDKNGKRKI